jgi:hypothetical protein
MTVQHCMEDMRFCIWAAKAHLQDDKLDEALKQLNMAKVYIDMAIMHLNSNSA